MPRHDLPVGRGTTRGAMTVFPLWAPASEACTMDGQRQSGRTLSAPAAMVCETAGSRPVRCRRSRVTYPSTTSDRADGTALGLADLAETTRRVQEAIELRHHTLVHFLETRRHRLVGKRRASHMVLDEKHPVAGQRVGADIFALLRRRQQFLVFQFGHKAYKARGAHLRLFEVIERWPKDEILLCQGRFEEKAGCHAAAAAPLGVSCHPALDPGRHPHPRPGPAAPVRCAAAGPAPGSCRRGPPAAPPRRWPRRR